MKDKTNDELRKLYDVAHATGTARAAWAERKRRGGPLSPPRWLRTQNSGRFTVAYPEGSSLFPTHAQRERAALESYARNLYAAQRAAHESRHGFVSGMESIRWED